MHDYLWDKLHPKMHEGLSNKDVIELMLNPDGKLWFKYQNGDVHEVGKIERSQALDFLSAAAQIEGKFINHDKPYLDAVLPFHGERLNATIAPISIGPSFNIRKHASSVYSLEDYCNAKIINAAQLDALHSAIVNRKNILVSGGPGSGKTTFANALLDSIASLMPVGHRVLLLEQVPELQCPIKNVKSMLTTDEISLNKLLWIAMRNSPDRIVVGEVRDSAIDLLKAWNTGCPGGIATIHANGAEAAMQRLVDLACEEVTLPPFSLIIEAVDLVIQIEPDATHPAGRRVSEICEVTGFNRETQTFQFKFFNEEHLGEQNVCDISKKCA